MKKKKDRPPALTPDDLITLARELAVREEFAEAEARLREALALAPDHLVAITILGFLLIDVDKIDAAIDLLEKGRDIAPAFPPIQLALGSAYAIAGHYEIAVNAMETAVRLDASSNLALDKLAKLHIRFGKHREAIGVLRRILRREPDNEQALFLLSGLENTSAPRSQPAALVTELFDSFASTFDKHLEGLEYIVPKALGALITTLAPSPQLLVDIGCGTGLLGLEVRASTRVLIGSDLSPKMIARARQRAIYDELHVEELAATLARTRDADVIAAADVFCYLGALDTTIAGIATALCPGGLLAFSTELSTGDDVVLQPSMRYAHSESYLSTLAQTNGLTVERAERVVLRLERREPVHGVLHAYRRPSV